MIKRLLNLVIGNDDQQKQVDRYRQLMRREAELGGQLFGPVPVNHRREFFCLDKNTWIWHEEWVDAQGQQQVKTTRYDIRPNAILKAQGNSYHAVSAEEGRNLIQAARGYISLCLRDIYGVSV